MSYDKITTWKAVCKKIGHDPKVLPDVSNLSKEDQINTIANFQAVKIAKAINMIDKENGETGQPEFIPYFYKNPFSFRHASWDDWDGGYCAASVGLCFVTRAGATHAGKVFLPIYKKLILGK